MLGALAVCVGCEGACVMWGVSESLCGSEVKTRAQVTHLKEILVFRVLPKFTA